MATADTWAAGLLNLTFLNTAFTGLGDAGGLLPSATAGSIYISLHTADPTAAGNQTSSEATFTNYARVAVARSGSGWSLSSTTMSNVAAITFPTCGVTSNTVTYFGIGTASAGAGKLMYSGQLTTAKTIANGDTASFAIGALTVAQT